VTWTGPAETPVSTRIAALAPSLRPSARRVVDLVATDLAAAVECTAQELAGRAGVGRATVIRTAQTLGYDGYPQMRVALARELALTPSTSSSAESPAGVLRSTIEEFNRNLPRLTAALTDASVEEFVAALDGATRVVVVAAGLSAPLGLDAAMRLSAAGRPAEYLPDPLSQQIAARNLDEHSVCLVLSGSGANEDSLAAAAAARTAGAAVLVVTSFSRAPLVGYADTALVIPPVGDSFPDELMHQSRAALALVLESLMKVLVLRRGERGVQAREAALTLIEKRLSE